MDEFDRDILEQLIENYSEKLETFRDGELYKWRAVACFQQNWNPDSPNFKEMLADALAETNNLLVSAMYYPKNMLLVFAENDPESVRSAMLSLFDKSQPLKMRMESFEGAMQAQLEAENMRLAQQGEKQIQNSYQDPRAMSVYLSMAHPEMYYLYKSSMYTTFAKKLRIKPPGNKFDKVIAYNDLLDDILSYIERNHASLISHSDNLLPFDLGNIDTRHHILMQDFVYFTAQQIIEKKQSNIGTTTIGDDIDSDSPDEPTPIYQPYTKEDFLSEVYLDEHEYDRLVSLMRNKKNVILQGAPGVGKTFAAKRLAYSIMGMKDTSRVELIQFHQSYSYEDFIMGFRPSETGFELRTGSFYEFCKKAEEDNDRDYFFIIDEINRGNLSKIFGELFMLLEADKRGASLKLLYSDEQFCIPPNVYLLGMMNTADRSLALLDYALRRRFAFYEMEPGFESQGFREYRHSLESQEFDNLIRCVQQLNAEIESDESLGRGFRIGHSYFCGLDSVEPGRLEEIVEYELVPLIQEYWFDEPGKVSDWTARLQDSIK